MLNKSDSESREAAINSIINEIREKSTGGDYIYRGEREKYEKISSALYRAYAEIIDPEEFYSGGFDLIRAQKGVLEVAKDHIGESPVGPLEDFIDVAKLNRERVGYTEDSMGRVFNDLFIETVGETIAETSDREILTELQHYGGTTNLIDFTTDYRIALYFACSGDYEETGRIVLLEKDEEIEKMLVRPRNPRHRVIAQKSVFLQPPRGYVSVSEVKIVDIPADLKQPMLEHLQRFYGISPESIYNDIHGFIRYRNIHESAYLQAYVGFLVHDRADTAESPEEEKRVEYEEAIKYYTEAIRLNPYFGIAYSNRGQARLHLRQWEDAENDLAVARDMDVDIVASFRKDYRNGVPEFEEKTGIRLPPYIAGMLGGAR